MPRVEVEMEIGGFRLDSFKVRIKADKEDIPKISGEIGKSILGVMQPPAAFMDEPVRKHVPSSLVNNQNGVNGNHENRCKGARRSKGGSGSNGNIVPLEWQHDSAKWGMPKQRWKVGQKVLWLMYVAKNECNQTELSAAIIAETFNAKFKQFGQLKRTSMPSILGALKTNEPSQLMDDTTKSPVTWYLSEEGSKAAEVLVQEARSTDAT